LNVVFYSQGVDFKIDKPDIVHNWLLEVAEFERKTIGRIEFQFVSEEIILRINREYLGHNYLTDIITFDNSFLNTVQGEIFICIPIVVKNSFKHSDGSFVDELYRVMVHGLLHMVGYNDRTNGEVLLIREKENTYLKLIHGVGFKR
jgi:rRNA maturation RNase YbeY